MLEAAVAGKMVKDLALPVAAGAGVYVAYKAARAAWGWTEDVVDKVKDNRDGIEAGIDASMAGGIADLFRFIF